MPRCFCVGWQRAKKREESGLSKENSRNVSLSFLTLDGLEFCRCQYDHTQLQMDTCTAEKGHYGERVICSRHPLLTNADSQSCWLLSHLPCSSFPR